MKKIFLGILAALILLIFGLVIFISTSWKKTYEAPTPDLKASTDSAIISRGRYLAYGPAHCASCHVPVELQSEVNKGVFVPMSGGFELHIPPGTFRAPNLTPDNETGIGKFTDGQLARAMRHSVKQDGGMMFPFMPFQEMSDADVVSVISYIRSQKAVNHVVKPTEYSFLGKALLALGVLKPVGPKFTPPVSVKKDTTVLYGKYITHSVANCVGCHTERDLKTGKNIGPEFAGGLVFEGSEDTKGITYVTPNITPDKETGIMATWSQKAFINRMRGGRIHSTSHMPWESYAKIDDIELKAVYAYLKSIAPVKRKVEKVVYQKGEALPK